MTYLTEADLAERLRMETDEVVALRRKHHWPHLRFGRYKVRYTEAQAAQIEAMHAVKPKAATTLPEQTDLSARRSA